MLVIRFFRLLFKAGKAWNTDQAPVMGAALAYYAAFSLAPLLILAVSLASVVLGEDAARTEFISRVRDNVGPATAEALRAMLDSSYNTGGMTQATLVGVALMLFGASGVFVQLQDSLNVIWKARARTSGCLGFLRMRLVSFIAVLCTGFLLLTFSLVNYLLGQFADFATKMGIPASSFAWQLASMVASLLLLSLLFAGIFKQLPDVVVPWGDVWLGGVLTAGLFTLGQHLIGWYLTTSGTASTFGAAGSLVVVLVWVYYSAQIVLFGAEFAHAYATNYGSLAKSKT